MMKKELTLSILSILLISVVSAGLSISEVKDVYNLGDKLYVTIDGIRGADEGNFNFNLVCPGATINLLKVSARAFDKNKDSSYSLPYKILSKDDLETSNISQILGQCYLQTTLGSEIVSGAKFKISNTIVLDASSTKGEYSPGETISLLISAKKENGQDYSGEIELSNFTRDLVLLEAVKTVEVEIDEDISAGNYAINLNLNDDMGNVGSKLFQFKISQVASRISFGVNKLDIMPGENISISGEVLDQSGGRMYEGINLELISPKGLKVTSAISPEKDVSAVIFPHNSTKGTWRIVATSGDLRDELEINVLPSSYLEYSLSDNILTITNIGNTIFNDYFNITIGNTERRIFTELEAGKSKQFVLSAPSGDYEIGLKGGKSTFAGSTFLTGNAISIKDLESGRFFGSSILWLILITIFGVGGYILIQNNPKTKKLAEKFPKLNTLKKNIRSRAPKRYTKEVSRSLNFTTKSPEVQSIDEKNYKSEDSSMKDFTLNKLKSAESSLVLKGEKVTGSVLSLKITNYEQLNQNSKEGLEKIVEMAKGQHAVVDKRDNYIFLLFVPQVTRTYKNELLATKSGVQIMEALSAFNKKYKQKILFNIGINTGEMIISKAQGKIKYTSLGNTLSFAKRLSDAANAKLIIDDKIRKKLLRDLKVEKHTVLNEKQTFSVISIKDKEANQEKLKEILKRM
jgi:hypothetical protein